VKKIVKRILSTLLIVSIIGILICVLISSLGVIVGGRSMQYVDDYDEYYIYKKDYKPFISFNFGEGGFSGYKIWFLPGRKNKLLKKIKEDVHTELANVVTNNSDIIKSYEVSDDFKKITIYYCKGAMEGRGNKFDEFAVRVATKVELYHQLIHGSGNVSLSNIIVELEEPYN
jgi:hypothetical protein